jgi:putative membrane protein
MDPEDAGIELHPSMIWRYTLFRGGIPALLAAGASFNLLSWYCLLFFLWVPLSYFINIRVYKNWSIRWDSDHLSIKRGFWTNSVSIMAWFKIQAVDIRQTPYQDRNDIANVWLYTAGGNIMIPYMHLEDAERVRDFTLYKAESTKKPWM